MAQFEVNSGVKSDEYDQITVDDHTETQSYFLQNVDLKKCTFLLVNNNLTNTLKLWMGENNYRLSKKYDATPPLINASATDQRNDIKHKIERYIDTHADFVIKLKKHYEADYTLINLVNFYGI